MLEIRYAMKIRALTVTFLVWPLSSVSVIQGKIFSYDLRGAGSIHSQRNNVISKIEVGHVKCGKSPMETSNGQSI
jgi:hypothetical protein